MMKKLVILFILCSILLVYAEEKINLDVGKSYLYEDKNITLVKADSKHDAAIFCVNGKKGIVGEGRISSINDLYIELIRLKTDSASVELSYECKRDCACGKECNNDMCFNKEDVISFIDEDSDGIIDEDEQLFFDTNNDGIIDEDEVLVEPISVEVQGIIIAILIIVVLFLGVIVLWKRS